MRTYLRLNGFSLPLLLLSIFCIVMLAAGRDSSPRTEWLPGKEFAVSLREDLFPGHDRNDLVFLNGQTGETNTVTLPPSRPAEKIDSAAEEEFGKANDLLRAGKNAAAKAALQAFLQKNPRHSEAWRQLGDCHYNTGKIDAAIAAYKKALAFASDNYLARRGFGVASLYLGYEFYEQEDIKLAHRYFQQALQQLHDCLEINANDQLAAYGQALAAEGVSRELYRIARKALNSDNEETAKNIIRNCLDILDVAVTAASDRISRRPEDDDARMLLGGLFLRRARMLQPFGHIAEASDNLTAALRAYEPVVKNGGVHAKNAEAQVSICNNLIKEWNH